MVIDNHCIYFMQICFTCVCVDIFSWVLGNYITLVSQVRNNYVYIVLLLFMTVIMILKCNIEDCM